MTRFSARMERIREDLIRRAQMERRANRHTNPDADADADADAMERGQHQQQQHRPQHQQQPEMQQCSPPRACTIRLAAMFSRPTAAILNRPGQSTTESENRQIPVVESPKSPRPGPDSEWPSIRSRLQVHAHTPHPELLHPPVPAVLPTASTNTEETPSQSQSSRRRRKRSQRVHQPKRFLFCFPWVQSRRVRSAAVYCFTSGLFLVLLLAVYLGLSTTQRIPNGELTIMLLLVILFSTVFFCYNIIRVCILLVRGDPSRTARNRRADGYNGAYAMPRQPIRVVLAQDDANKLNPPAYGLWRESVRLDPNRLYWQRSETAPSASTEVMEPATGPRPPSYASDDGVSYVVEAISSSSTTSTQQSQEQTRRASSQDGPDASRREPVVVSV